MFMRLLLFWVHIMMMNDIPLLYFHFRDEHFRDYLQAEIKVTHMLVCIFLKRKITKSLGSFI